MSSESQPESQGEDADRVPDLPSADSAPADYETASGRLDEIIARLDSGEAQLRETLDLCAEAKTLIEFCAAELAAVDQGLKELRLEDLAESLKAPGRAAEARPDSSAEPSPPAEEAPPTPEEPPF